ncbi:hypothetical protein FVE85_3722 [Porphyridium purpureum]|uniref:Transmembrane protein n=1 Tax=Porphyridium purpureum TaxID=35688 RepID=A0A5J4YNN1_PORPP|nr:hypothetical protein FVE85_3722 [Porphyridium purpureum]|eukprot:POR3176..scf249_10
MLGVRNLRVESFVAACFAAHRKPEMAAETHLAPLVADVVAVALNFERVDASRVVYGESFGDTVALSDAETFGHAEDADERRDGLEDGAAERPQETESSQLGNNKTRTARWCGMRRQTARSEEAEVGSKAKKNVVTTVVTLRRRSPDQEDHECGGQGQPRELSVSSRDEGTSSAHERECIEFAMDENMSLVHDSFIVNGERVEPAEVSLLLDKCVVNLPVGSRGTDLFVIEVQLVVSVLKEHETGGGFGGLDGLYMRSGTLCGRCMEQKLRRVSFLPEYRERWAGGQALLMRTIQVMVVCVLYALLGVVFFFLLPNADDAGAIICFALAGVFAILGSVLMLSCVVRRIMFGLSLQVRKTNAFLAFLSETLSSIAMFMFSLLFALSTEEVTRQVTAQYKWLESIFIAASVLFFAFWVATLVSTYKAWLRYKYYLEIELQDTRLCHLKPELDLHPMPQPVPEPVSDALPEPVLVPELAREQHPESIQ